MRTEADTAFEKMLDAIAGSPATGKFVAGIINLFVDLVGTGGTEMEQRNKAFVGRRILNQDRALKLAKSSLLQKWR